MLLFKKVKNLKIIIKNKNYLISTENYVKKNIFKNIYIF